MGSEPVRIGHVRGATMRIGQVRGATMRNEHRGQWPVVIAGAGPAGLVAGITLAQAGVDCLVVDRHRAPAPLPRATVVSVRSMELLRSWGLEAEVRAGGNDVEWRMLVAPTLAEADAGHLVDVGYPTTAESRTLSPTAPAC